MIEILRKEYCGLHKNKYLASLGTKTAKKLFSSLPLIIKSL